MNTPGAGQRLLLVGGPGPSSLSVDACRRAVMQARNLGLRVTVTVADTGTSEAKAVAAIAELVTVDIDDSRDRRRFLGSLGPFTGVVFGVRDATQIAVAEVAEALGALGNPVEAVRRAVHKDQCRATLAAAGLRQPEVILCGSIQEAESFLRRTQAPWIVKPRNASASIGVTRISRADELPGAMAVLPNPTEPFLVETFVVGDEFSVEGCFLGGQPTILACTAKRTLSEGRFVEVGHVLPAALSAETEFLLTDAVCRALRALGLRFGIFHVEGWIDGGRVVIGEVHTRVAGDWIHSMVEYARPDTELFRSVFADALGVPQPCLGAPRRRAAAVYLVPPPGLVAAIDGWAAVAAHPQVLHAELRIGVGDMVPECRSSRDRIGVVVTGVPDVTGDAEGVARSLCRSVTFTMGDGRQFDGLGRAALASAVPARTSR